MTQTQPGAGTWTIGGKVVTLTEQALIIRPRFNAGHLDEVAIRRADIVAVTVTGNKLLRSMKLTIRTSVGVTTLAANSGQRISDALEIKALLGF
jgi:hypothetical protein